MAGLSAAGVIIAGFGIGVAAGFTARRAGLCSFGAIEDAWMGGDTRRLRIFGLALAIALIGAQAMAAMGLLDLSRTSYAPTAIPWLAALSGGLMFGVGMALVGTCGFGCLIRLGGGDLRSLIVLIVFGAVAYATLRGALSDFRIAGVERVAVKTPGGVAGDLPSLMSFYGWRGARLWVAVGAGAVLIAAVLLDPRLRRAPRLITAGTTLGLGVALGWLATGVLVDEFDLSARAQSLTFVAPVGKALFGAILSPHGFLDFGVASVGGVAVGSHLAARAADEFRWEAFDDHHEMRRHLAGAALMGVGGILAGGCTIGQGVTAGSAMALTWPLSIGGMMIGARLGIAFLIDFPSRSDLARYFRDRRVGRPGPAR